MANFEGKKLKNTAAAERSVRKAGNGKATEKGNE